MPPALRRSAIEARRPAGARSGEACTGPLERIIAAEPDHGRALGNGAGLLATLGEAERAKEWIERGTLVDPENTILHFNFVCALSRLREFDAAIDCCPM